MRSTHVSASWSVRFMTLQTRGPAIVLTTVQILVPEPRGKETHLLDNLSGGTWGGAQLILRIVIQIHSRSSGPTSSTRHASAREHAYASATHRNQRSSAYTGILPVPWEGHYHRHGCIECLPLILGPVTVREVPWSTPIAEHASDNLQDAKLYHSRNVLHTSNVGNPGLKRPSSYNSTSRNFHADHLPTYLLNQSPQQHSTTMGFRMIN